MFARYEVHLSINDAAPQNSKYKGIYTMTILVHAQCSNL